jgi:hypothetical protein
MAKEILKNTHQEMAALIVEKAELTDLIKVLDVFSDNVDADGNIDVTHKLNDDMGHVNGISG